MVAGTAESEGGLTSYSMLKVPIAMIGSWPHPTYGKVEFSAEDLDAAIANFNAGALGFEPHLSFGHLDEEPNSTDSARKRGNLKYLIKEGERLDGYFAVPPGTTEVVSQGGYEYSSGEFIRNLMDKDSGKYRGMAISRVALTNTPYLPWGEQGKIQLLSHTGNVPVDLFTNAVRLSTAVEPVGESIPDAVDRASPDSKEGPSRDVPIEGDTIDLTPLVSVPIVTTEIITEATPTQDEPVAQVETVEEEDSMTIATEQTAPLDQAAPSTPEAVVSVPNEVTAVVNPATNAVDINAITAAILEKVNADQEANRAKKEAEMKAEQDRIKGEKDAEVAKSNELVLKLEAQMAELTERLAKAETNASAFTNHATRAAQEAEAMQLMSMGASATLVHKYAAIREALDTKSGVVKLSQAGVEKESSLMESIRDLLVGALQQTPVVSAQMGLAGAPGEEEGGVKGYLEKIVTSNRQKATKIPI